MFGFNIKQNWIASREFSNGMKHLENGRYDEALPHLEKSYDLNKKEHYTVLNLAINYLSVSNYDKALERIDEAIELSPKNPVAYLYKAFICLKMDKLKDSEAAVDHCLKYDPKNPHCNYLRGLICMLKKEYKDACDYFEQYTVFNKPEVFARVLLASELFLFDKMKDIKPDNDDSSGEMIKDKELQSVLADFYEGREQIASDKIYGMVENRKFDHTMSKILLASEMYFNDKNIKF